MISQANAKTKPHGMEIRRFGMPYRACPWNMQKPTAGKGPQGNRGTDFGMGYGTKVRVSLNPELETGIRVSLCTGGDVEPCTRLIFSDF